MVSFTTSDYPRIMISAAGALAIWSVCIFGAIDPVQAGPAAAAPAASVAAAHHDHRPDTGPLAAR